MVSLMTVFLMVIFAACENNVTSTESLAGGTAQEAVAGQAKGNKGQVSETQSMFPIPFNQPGFNAEGSVTLKRNASNNTLHWNINVSGVEGAPGFEKGNAYTVWVGNFLESDADGGWGSGGIVGGNGSFNTAGNHCIWPLVTFTDGGFRPGTKPDCDMIDVTQQVAIFVLDHGEWEPGDMIARWDPTSGTSDELALAGALGVFFGPLD